MPGVIMDQDNIGGRGGQMNGILPASATYTRSEHSVQLQNRSTHANGVGNVELRQNDEKAQSNALSASIAPPELQHVTQGFFPFSKLVNRSVQQCWNDLSDLIAELAEIQVTARDPNTTPISSINGKLPGNQTPENLRKKLRALEFAQAKRADFIKLLVLSQWGRQAADVSKLVDIQNFIRMQQQSYMSALQWMGDMKRDLVRAQVANPDLRTALEVLSKGEVIAMPDLGYKPPKPLDPRSTLSKLRQINRIISAKLALHERIPFPFQSYRVHDGRVTFVVPGAFELDLSIGEENIRSQFFFVDIHFLFKPSTPIPAGRMFSELDLKINDILRTDGLTGCFAWLNNLVLTNKINILTKQAAELARGLWSNVLRIELLHRTLVLQYWASKPGAKSWLEIGIRRGSRTHTRDGQHSPSLGLRWTRDGQEVDSEAIELNTENLSVESLLRSVIALHISHILTSVFTSFSSNLLYSSGSLSLRAHLTRTEPGDCHLDVQLTASRRLRVAIEPMSGAIILAATPNILERIDTDRNADRPTVEDILSRVGRLRCAAAIEEVESKVKLLGLESVNPRNVKIDPRRIFPTNVLRFSFFCHRLWERNWLLAATSSMDGDKWWVVHVRSAEPTALYPSFALMDPSICSADVICNVLLPVQQTGYASVADLGHCLTGVLTMYANARFLEDMRDVKFYPSLDKLKVGSGVQVPDLSVQYDPSKLPESLRMALPAGIKKKAFVTDTIRLAFHGVDRHRNVAMIVVYGRFCTSLHFDALASQEDSSIVFQKNGAGFALRLLAPPGHSVVLDLLERLQRLECVLSIYEILQQKKMETRSLSLSRIDFAYGPDRDLFAHLEIGVSQPLLATGVDQFKISSTKDRLFHLRLGIRFDPSNPHRRIQGPLAANLNHPTIDAALDTLTELLSFTLPLMQALDRIMANPTRNEPLKVHVTVRNAKSFQIHYPLERYRFHLVAHQHHNRAVWVLRHDPGPQNETGRQRFERKLQEGLFNSEGNGWKGLGTGIVTEPSRIGNLLDELDRCLLSIRADVASKSLEISPSHEAQAPNNQLPVNGQPEPGGRNETAGRNVQQKAGAAQPKTDVIMID
ncbi:mediator complex subunit MED14-domain-containing protein [Aspergillus egyptiacus]|nr:mediator complex subunit MED14-domain-containing protein [Aspergillus egyptiacus]